VVLSGAQSLDMCIGGWGSLVGGVRGCGGF